MPGASTSALISVSGSSSESIGLDPRFGERLINGMEAEASGTEFCHSSVPVTAGSVDLVASMGDEAGNLGYATNSITVTIITNAAYGYDNAGNLTTVSYNSGSRTLGLSWNQQYQLSSASTNGSVAESYTYDAHGRLLTTTTGSDTIVHVYDGIHCIADVDEDGDVIRSYVHGPGVDNILAMTVHGETTNTYYYLTDHLGSVLAITDDSGAVVETYQYDAYGRTTVYDADGMPMDESALGNRFAFHGREVCWTTGLMYFRARWYDQVTGRWLSKDPIGISGGLNQYVAFGNCPAGKRDPFGLDDTRSSAQEGRMLDGEDYIRQYSDALRRQFYNPGGVIFDRGYDARGSGKIYRWRGGELPGDSMGNVGIGYAATHAYGPIIAGSGAVCAEFLQPPWEGWGAAVGSWRDNIAGIIAGMRDDPIRTFLGSRPESLPLLHFLNGVEGFLAGPAQEYKPRPIQNNDHE